MEAQNQFNWDHVNWRNWYNNYQVGNFSPINLHLYRQPSSGGTTPCRTPRSSSWFLCRLTLSFLRVTTHTVWCWCTDPCQHPSSLNVLIANLGDKLMRASGADMAVVAALVQVAISINVEVLPVIRCAQLPMCMHVLRCGAPSFLHRHPRQFCRRVLQWWLHNSSSSPRHAHRWQLAR
jgi:hypothetical protein